MGKEWLFRRLLLWGVLGCLLFGAAGPAWAGSAFFDALHAVPDEELAQMRGGYTSAGGVEVAFGIETAVFIDGILQAVTSFNSTADVFSLPDPRIVMATGLNSNSVGMQLVNSQLTMESMDVDALKSQLMTVVQNSQDHRVIDNITQLNAVVTSLDAFRQIRFLDSLQQQMIDSGY